MSLIRKPLLKHSRTQINIAERQMASKVSVSKKNKKINELLFVAGSDV